MKTIKKLFSIALAFAGLGFIATACSDEVTYSSAEELQNAQVFFANTLPSSYATAIDPAAEGAGVINVTLSRVKTDGALTVPLKAVLDSATIYTVPASVEFPAGASTVDIPVTYDVANVVYDAFEDITISIDGVDLTTPYGNSEYTFTAGVAAPWKYIGMGTYVDDLFTTFWGVANIPYEVPVEENELYPGLYRMVNPYGEYYPYNDPGDWDPNVDSYIEIDATDPDKVFFYTQEQHTAWGDYGNFIVGSRAGHFKARGDDESTYAEYYGTLRDGEITFPAGSLLIGMANYNNGGLYRANTNGAFSLLLPGYSKRDVSASVSYAGIFNDKSGATEAVADVELGPDAEGGLLALVSGSADDAETAAGMLDGSVPSVSVTSGRYQIAFEGDGLYKFVLASLYDGAVAEIASTRFEYVSPGAPASPWQSIGTGYYTEDMLTTFFQVDNITYEVEVEANSDVPGLYRLVYPYGAGYSYNEDGDYDTSMTYYLEINASDPAHVYFTTQEQGLDWGYGMMSVSSVAGLYTSQGYSVDEVIGSQGEVFGTLSNGEITFPTESLLIRLANYNSGNLYVANTHGAFKVVLPTAAASARRSAARAAVVSSLSKSRRFIAPTPTIIKPIKSRPMSGAKYFGK